VSAAATQPLTEIDYEQQMVERYLSFRHDPLACVLYSFPFGEGELADDPGPRKFQRDTLLELAAWLQDPATRYMPYRKAISSGHGIGKSTLLGWIIHWAQSTCLDCKVIVTANTGDQLSSKTQPEISKWFRLALNKDWFDVHVTSIKMNDAEHETTWRTDFNTWSKENPQAFAGAHNKGKRLVIVFDEASEIANSIYETVEGALTDKNTEIIWLCMSQSTKAEGTFYEAVHGNQRGRWHPLIIDSREVEGTNVEEINATAAVYGEDSDTVRVRYRGLFPVAGGGKFIDLKTVQEAQRRQVYANSEAAVTAGVDFAWGGTDDNVIRFRQGLDARTIPPRKVKGEFTRDPAVMTGKLVDVLTEWHMCADGVKRKVDMLFFDSAGIAAPVEYNLRALGYGDRIMVVNFGADSPKPTCAYFRDFMWEEMKQWLRTGAIDTDPELSADLQKPVLISDPKQRIKLEPKDAMKRRYEKAGLKYSSPDDADALALTFAHPVLPKKDNEAPPEPEHRTDGLGWMG
jgi:hypothetical protein